jgi:hypothetical protein
MRRLIPLLFVLALTQAVDGRQSATIYTSAKTAIAANPDLLEDSYVRMMLVHGYTPSAAHDFLNDVQAFEVTDDDDTPIADRQGYYVPGYGSPFRIKLTNRVNSGNTLVASDVLYPWLVDLTFDGIVLFYYDRNCSATASASMTAANCRTGASHPLIAYFPVTETTITNQPLIIDWGTSIINHSDASSANWTATIPTIRPVTFNNVALDNLSGGTVAQLTSGGEGVTINSGTASVWNRYYPTTAGGVIFSDFDIPPNLQYVLFDGLKVNGYLNSGFPTSIEGFESDGCDYCGFKDIEAASDLRTDRGDVQANMACWNGTTLAFLTTCEQNAGEDGSSTGTGQSWPSGVPFATSSTSSHVFVLRGYFHGYRNGGTNDADTLFLLDTLMANVFDTGSFTNEYGVFFRSAIFNGPNHQMSFKASPTTQMTFHMYDSVMGQGQDWITADSTLSVNGAEEAFIQHNVFFHGANLPSGIQSVNSLRLDRIRQQLVILDNAFSWNKADSLVRNITRDIIANDAVLIDYNVFDNQTRTTWTQPIGLKNVIASNSAPADSASANWLTLTDTNKIRVTFTALRSQATDTFLDNRWLTDRTGIPAGTVTTRIETDNSGSPSGTAVWTNTVNATSFSTATTYLSQSARLTGAITEGQTYHLIMEGDATYKADYLAGAGARRVNVAPSQFATTAVAAYTWNGSAWVSVSKNIGYFVGFAEDTMTIAEWVTLAGNGSNNSIAALDVDDFPTFTVPFPSQGTEANLWGFVKPRTIGTVRSYFQPATGSPLENTASDGTNIGLSGGASEPSDPGDPVNTAPNSVNAGADQTVELSGSTSLNCTATDDGLPTATLTYVWSKVSGPSTTTFSPSANVQTPTVTFGATGSYVLRCTVSDSAPLSATDDVAFTVNDTAMPTNAAPSVNLGADRTYRIGNLGDSLWLTPTITDDGLDEAYTSFWCITAMPGNLHGWRLPGCVPYVLNIGGSDLSMASQYAIKQESGYSNDYAAFTPAATDPQNTHVIAFKATGGTGSWSYIGQSSAPRGTRAGVSQVGPTVAVTPPSMNSGDLVVLFGAYRASNVTVAMSEAGGQTWTCGTNTQNAGNALTTRLCHAVYDGTWDANPSMTVTAGTDGMTVWMQVFRPPSGGTVAVDVAEATTTGAGSALVTLGSNSTTVTNTLSVAFVADQDDNRWLPQATKMPAFFTTPDEPYAVLYFPVVGLYTVCLTVSDGDVSGTGLSTQDCVNVTALPRNKVALRRLR